MRRRRRCGAAAVLVGLCWACAASVDAAEAPQTYAARDSLAPAAESRPDARECLAGLTWKPAEFTVSCEPVSDADYQALVRFPSPLDTGDAVNDRVALLWHRPPGDDLQTPRPTLIVVHESGSAMPVGRMFARAFAAKGFHALMIQLPHYGFRKRDGVRPDGERFLLAMRQSIADVRRARDAAAVLPGVDARRISVQGTSLGGFVTATTAGLDRGFDQVFIMLAGGDLEGLVLRGEKEAADLRRRLAEAGYTGEKLKTLMQAIEPTRLAHRLDPERTWLYSAEQDKVVPLENAFVFAKAGGLPETHHLRLWGDHTSTIIYFPVIINHVVERLSPAP